MSLKAAMKNHQLNTVTVVRDAKEAKEAKNMSSKRSFAKLSDDRVRQIRTELASDDEDVRTEAHYNLNDYEIVSLSQEALDRRMADAANESYITQLEDKFAKLMIRYEQAEAELAELRAGLERYARTGKAK
jgi:hypothetical protein